MRFHSHEALILEVMDLQDGDRIVAFLTRERGNKRGVARGARRTHSRFSGQLQPLAKVRLHWHEKEGRDLVRISGVDILRPARRLDEELEGLLLGSYLADHMLRFAQEDEPSELYYRLLDSTVEALAEGVDRDLAARYFELWILRLAGIFPPPTECPSCGRPYGEDGGEAGAVLPAAGEALLCGRCARAGGSAAGDLQVPSTVLDLFLRFGRCSLSALAAERLPADEVLRRAEEVSGRIRRAFLGHELKSYQVMHKTLAGLPKERPPATESEE